MSGHYEIEPETAIRAKGILRIYWVEPTADGPRRTHLWNMADQRLALLGEAVTAYMAEHPPEADDEAGQPRPDDQSIPLPRSTR
jgi:hypothetical protein